MSKTCKFKTLFTYFSLSLHPSKSGAFVTLHEILTQSRVEEEGYIYIYTLHLTYAFLQPCS